jgi:DNA ligase-4
MITWDMEEDKMVPFGTLKTAALSEQRNPHSGGSRPLYKAFDCLYVNDKPITKYTLRDRRKALEASVKSINRRLEIHEFKEAHKASDIEPMLRQVVAEASEGLVIKSPGSMYRLNERNDDWIKVKPEYMTEFGEDLDCVIVGGYFGSGRRGGTISSFMCGLRVNDSHIKQGANPQKTYSFFKVGGGLGANDYAEIRHITDGKWKDWDPKKPPTDYLELAGGDRQFERPDVWIKPEDSVVVSVKGASVGTTDQFRMGLTLRFPRFKKLRRDKDWHAALSINDFLELKRNAEKQQQEKKFEIDNERKKRRAGISKRKKPLTIAGAEDGESVNQYAGPDTQLFDGLTFFVISDSTEMKKSKPELEQMIKANGGMIVQTLVGKETFICIGEKKNLKARSIEKAGDRNIVKPQWLLDCIEQNKSDEGLRKFLLPFEPR